MKQKEEFRNKLSQIIDLSVECWDELQDKLYVKTVENEGYFSVEESITKEIAYVSSGILRIYYLDANGLEWNKKFLVAGDFVMANINPNEKSKVFIQALQKTELIGIHYPSFEKLMSEHIEISLLAQRLMTRYLNAKQGREIELLSMKAKNRYKRFLEEYSTIKNDIAQYHIASYLGITPTQLSRIRKKIGIHQHL